MPPYPRVAMLAIADPWEISLSLPAREKASGIMTAMPMPIKPKPMTNGTRELNVNTMIEPSKAINPE